MNLHLIAPSGSLPDASVLANGEAWFKQKNIKVTNLECGRRQFQRFAGADHERLKEVNDLALVSPDQVVMALRGGYGLSRLLDQINWAGIANQVSQGLKIVGHSDFTAFCLALFAKTGAPSFAGPMFSYDFCGDVSEFTWKHFHDAMSKKVIEVEVIAPQVMAKPLGVTDAVLWGGNLTMLTSLLGTEYLPSIDQVRGGILFIEDVNEHPYRIERMLQQLIDAGYLGQQKAVILGDISSYRLSDVDRGYDLNAALHAIRQRLGDSLPVLTGLPFGHCPDKLTLPVGRTASLSASSSGYILKANCA
ncbi:MAG: LD-carboxypeptidase [Polynucleobacter victoriensis]